MALAGWFNGRVPGLRALCISLGCAGLGGGEEAAEPVSDVGAPHRVALQCPAGTAPGPATDVAFEGAVCVRPDGVPQGPMVAWWSDGTKEREGAWVEGRQDGPWKLYDREGRVNHEGHFRLGNRIGEWRSTMLGLPMEQGSYDDEGRKDGPWTSWWPKAGSPIWRRVTYRAGLGVGPWEAWHPNGQASEAGTLVDGRFEGEWSRWAEDGTLIERGQYRGDAPVGAWTWFKPDGSVERSCDFDDPAASAGCEAPSPPGP